MPAAALPVTVVSSIVKGPARSESVRSGKPSIGSNANTIPCPPPDSADSPTTPPRTMARATCTGPSIARRTEASVPPMCSSVMSVIANPPGPTNATDDTLGSRPQRREISSGAHERDTDVDDDRLAHVVDAFAELDRRTVGDRVECGAELLVDIAAGFDRHRRRGHVARLGRLRDRDDLRRAQRRSQAAQRGDDRVADLARRLEVGDRRRRAPPAAWSGRTRGRPPPGRSRSRRPARPGCRAAGRARSTPRRSGLGTGRRSPAAAWQRPSPSRRTAPRCRGRPAWWSTSSWSRSPTGRRRTTRNRPRRGQQREGWP